MFNASDLVSLIMILCYLAGYLAVYGLALCIERRIIASFLDKVSVMFWKTARFVSISVFLTFLICLPFLHEKGLDRILEAAMVLLALIFIFYLGSYPAESAFWLYRTLKKFDPYQKVLGFWNLYDLNRHFRKLIIGALFCLAFLVIALDFYFFAKISLAQKSGYWLLFAGIFFAGFIILVFVLDHSRLRRQPPEADHQRKSELLGLIQTLSIAAGIQPPGLRIINLKTPTAYTAIDDISAGRHTIYVSAGMINLLDRSELEAVLAHELSHLRSGQPLDYYKLSALLSLLKAVGGGFVILAVAGAFPILVLFWMFVLVMLALESHNNESPYIINNDSIIYSLFILLMPAYSIINFLGCLIYYHLSANEDYYADLNAILLTRFPQGLFCALDRLDQDKKRYYGEFFTKLNLLYFTGEGIYNSIPQPQPSIARRKELISRIDATLKGFATTPKASMLPCPACQRQMEHIRADSHYIKNNVELDKCPNCHSVWFDGYELYYIADLTLVSAKDKVGIINEQDFQDKIKCPHCGVIMQDIRSSDMPADINIWNCPTCNGNFMTNEDIYRFGTIRKQTFKTK